MRKKGGAENEWTNQQRVGVSSLLFLRRRGEIRKG
jgi:hypothetical protein